MHFTIPEVIERKDDKGSSFMTFEVHLNGLHHCSVRYRQLHNLHQQLKRELSSQMPMFPPKKLMMLTAVQLEDRRSALEKYLQLISQDPRISCGLAFNGFLLATQQETWTEGESGNLVDLEVYLMNDQKFVVRGRSTIQSDEVLENVCKQIGIPDELVYNFGLFLIFRQEKCIQIVRKFQDYESPYISMKSNRGDGIKLVIGKFSWDLNTDVMLCANKSSLNVLYIQTLSDVESGMLQATNDVRKQLASMQARGAKAEYMELARNLKDYGYVHFLPCVCDYPVTNSRALVVIGGRELVIRMVDKKGEVKEGQFRITRMRCWRIMPAEESAISNLKAFNQTSSGGGRSCGSCPPALELSFEYLMPATKEMQWISITSPQAILMSICLQSIVEELLRIRNDQPPKKPGSAEVRQYVHKKLDGSEISLQVRCPSSASLKSKMQGSSLTKGKSGMARRQYTVRSLSEKFDVVQMKEASKAAENVLIENDAFQDVKECEEL